MSSVATNVLRVELLSAQTANSTASTPIDVLPYPYVSIYVIGTGTLSTGVITIETAYIKPADEAAGYTGTWSSVTTVNASDVTGGAQKQVVLTAGAYSHVRTRISTGVTGGGSISTALCATA